MTIADNRALLLISFFALNFGSIACADEIQAKIDYWRARRDGTGTTVSMASKGETIILKKKVGDLIVLRSPRKVNVSWDVPKGLAVGKDYLVSKDSHTLFIPSPPAGEWTVKLWAVRLNVLTFWPTYPPTFIPPTHIALGGRPELIGIWTIRVRR